MKHEPLKIIISITIAVCVIAIAASFFLLKADDEPEEKVVNTTAVDINKTIPEKDTEHQYIIIKKDGKFTFADLDGQRSTDQFYDVLSVADNGMYYFKQGAVQGFLDENHRVVFSTEETIATNVSEEFVIYSANGKKGFINIANGDRIKAVYDAVQDFSEGLAAVQIGGATGFINTSGELVIACEYSNNAFYQFKSGLCNVMVGSADKGNLKAFYINSDGSKMFDKEFDYCMPFSEERAFVSEGGVWYLIDIDGQRVGDSEFGPYVKTVPGVFRDGKAVVVKEGMYGIINRDGEYVVSPRYEQISEISDGGAVFKMDGLYGYMTTEGSVVITPRYQSLTNFKNGLAVFCQDQKYGVVDKAASVIVNAEYEDITLLDNGLIKISVTDTEIHYRDRFGSVVYETGSDGIDG